MSKIISIQDASKQFVVGGLYKMFNDLADSVHTKFTAGGGLGEANAVVGIQKATDIDNETRLAVMAVSEGAYGVADKVTVHITLYGRRAQLNFSKDYVTGKMTSDNNWQASIAADEVVRGYQIASALKTAVDANALTHANVGGVAVPKVIPWAFTAGATATLNPTDTLQLTHTPTAVGTPAYYSDDTSVATVDSAGEITAVAVGSVTIRSSLGAKIVITVEP